jgi:hypothetical protein
LRDFDWLPFTLPLVIFYGPSIFQRSAYDSVVFGCFFSSLSNCTLGQFNVIQSDGVLNYLNSLSVMSQAAQPGRQNCVIVEFQDVVHDRQVDEAQEEQGLVADDIDILQAKLMASAGAAAGLWHLWTPLFFGVLRA